MGILANTVSICQFRVVGEIPATELFALASESLGRHAFRSIDQGTAELSVGWVHTGNPQESAFAVPGDFWHDHYIAFSLRQDRRKIPAALLKAYLQVAEHEFLAANPGYRKVPKQKKEELRESVHNMLLARTLPIPAVYDAVWDTRSNILSFTSLGRGTQEAFETLFRKSFPDLRLTAVHPFARAAEVVADELKPALLAANRATSDTALDLIASNRWIGSDFLLWILFRTMTGSAEYRVCRPGPESPEVPFTAYLNDRLVLMSAGESGLQKVTVAGTQDRFSEVCTALRQGKGISEAAIIFEKGDELWKMTLKGEMFHFASFKCPKVKEEKDNTVDAAAEREALFFERMALLETGLQLFDSLFAQFLAIRLGQEWNGEAGEILEWLATE
ncbi:MAG TPA: recombination-associated protein RdgC [Geobacteraceae bacterium]|nr:recombination-associated protein RdgC [Geobacteraceae bacterium]